jgi:hypothetical protein
LERKPFVHRQNYNVHFFATELHAQAAAVQGNRAWRRPVATIPTRNESPSVAYSNNDGTSFESRNDHDAIGIGEFSRPNVVSRLHHLVKNSSGFPESCGRVIRASRSENCNERQREEVLCFSHECCPFVLVERTQRSNRTHQ